jgi:hypothetical protein
VWQDYLRRWKKNLDDPLNDHDSPWSPQNAGFRIILVFSSGIWRLSPLDAWKKLDAVEYKICGITYALNSEPSFP